MIKSRAAVIPASGLGDALIMMVASERLRREGYEVTTFQPHLHELSEWFTGHQFETLPPADDLGATLSQFELVILQNDNSPTAKMIIDLHRRGTIPRLSTLYHEYSYSKHGALGPHDVLLDTKRTLVENVAIAISLNLNLKDYSKNNGIQIPDGMVKTRYPKRVILHPSASDSSKMWPLQKFLKVAEMLHKEGFDPIFILSPKERASFEDKIPKPFALMTPKNLHELAQTLYESRAFIGNGSGPSHLASLLHLPSVTLLGFDPKFRLWHPGWLASQVLTPPRWALNMKWFRWKELYWDRWIPLYLAKRSLHSLIKDESLNT